MITLAAAGRRDNTPRDGTAELQAAREEERAIPARLEGCMRGEGLAKYLTPVGRPGSVSEVRDVQRNHTNKK